VAILPCPIRRLAALRLSWQLTSYLARGGVNLALEQLEEDLAGRSLITARYRWSRLTPWFYAWQLLARPCGLSFPGLKSCSAQRLSLFKLCGHSSRAGWRDWSTACRDVTALICQVDFGNLILKRNSHLETSLNQSLQLQSIPFRCDNFGCLQNYHEDHALLPSMWLKEWRNLERKWSCSWSYNILHVDTKEKIHT